MALLVILNPIAGKGKALALKPEIENHLSSRGVPFTVEVTEGVLHAASLAEEAGERGFDTVVAAGGDGTCNEVINGLMKQVERSGPEPASVPALGVLPVGRGNDFAYGLGLPGDFSLACRILTEHSPVALDIGRITGGYYPQGRYFGNGIGIGFDTMVGLEAAKLKHVHGFGAYIWGAVKTFIRFPEPPAVTLGYGSREINVRANQISILNGRRMGGTFFMAPQALTDDGLLDLCMTTHPLSRREMAGLIIRYTKGSQAEHEAILTDRSSVFTIQAPSGGLVCHADGETICTNGEHLQVELLPGALQVIRPANNTSRPGEGL